MTTISRKARINELNELLAGVYHYPKIWIHCDGFFMYRGKEYTENQFMLKVNRLDRLIGIGEGLNDCIQDKELLKTLIGIQE